MHKWIAGSTCAAAVLSLAVASAQTYPPTADNRPTTTSAPANKSGGQRTAAQRVTMTGCLMRGTNAQSTSWLLSNATTTQGTVNEATVGTSRSGSPSNEGTTAGNRNGTAGIGVAGSTSTAIGTSGTNNPTASIDTEAHGGGTVGGATDRNGSTVGGGATAAVTGESPNAAADDDSGRNANRNNRSNSRGQSAQNSGTSTSAGAGTSYQLTGVRNPTQYMNKRVEVIGTMSNAGNSGNQTLRVTSVRVLGDTCQ